ACDVASVTSVWPTARRPSPVSVPAPMRGVPLRLATLHDAPVPVDFQVRATMTMIAAAAASDGARNRTVRQPTGVVALSYVVSASYVLSAFRRTVLVRRTVSEIGGAGRVVRRRPSSRSRR